MDLISSRYRKPKGRPSKRRKTLAANAKKRWKDIPAATTSADELKMTSEPNVKHTGGCHCGSVRFTAFAPSKVKSYHCNCSVCIKKQIKGFIVLDEDFKLLTGADNLTEYTFNTKQAKHWFCKTCGVQSFYKPRSNPNGITIMICCLDPGTIEEVEEIHFDGQNWEDSIKNLQPVHS